MKLTKVERRALRRLRDEETAMHVHGKTRHALQRKGLVRGRPRGGWTLTPAGHAALSPPGIPDIFADLFFPSKGN